jgi:hypothetical protein
LGQRTRKTSESSSKQSIPSGPPPVWEIAAQFFIQNTGDTMPMEVDDCLQVDTDLHVSDLTPLVEQKPNRDCDSHHDSIELGEQDNEDDLDEAGEPGTSDQEGHGRVQDDQKDHR